MARSLHCGNFTDYFEFTVSGATDHSMVDAARSSQLDTEEDLIQRAQEALNHCNWVIGECAAAWTERYARGRTDADFGARVGLSGDQIFQRRRVWETFSDVRNNYSRLKWSHFYAALNWDDAAECLQWADEMQATIAEMKAWRRAQRGEDLTVDSQEESFAASAVEYLSVSPGFVKDPGDSRGERVTSGPRERAPWEEVESATVTAAARELDGGEPYAPFGKDARGSAPVSATDKPAPSTEQTYARIAAALERCDKALTPDILDHFEDVTPDTRRRFLAAMKSLKSKTATFQ